MRNLREGVDMVTVRTPSSMDHRTTADIADLVHGHIHVSPQAGGARAS